MNQFGIILQFELKNFFKNKIFVGVTVVLVLLIAAVMFFPRVMSFHAEETSDTQNSAESGAMDAESDSVMLIASDADGLDGMEAMLQEAFAAAFPDYQVKLSEDGIETIKEQITSGEVECAFLLHGLTSYTYYVDNLSMYDSNTYTADEVLQNIYRMSAMEESGVSAEKTQEILSAQIEEETESLGKDQMENYWYTYIMIFALYIVILLYGQMVATNVATEKSSRAMELLITSAKPVSMMFGKVIASCLAGLVQLICVFGSACLFFHINKSYWGENQIINSIFDMPPGLLVYMLIFFVLGFLMYAFLYGAVGSTASKLEDINTLVMPITMIFIIAFIIVMFSMVGNVDNILMRVCSYVPFTSPMAMFTRIAMSTVPAYEILISILILIASVFGVGVLSAKIYRMGVLLYGTTPKIGSILKSVWKA
jgi:ABC-2 type transport system permease protein